MRLKLKINETVRVISNCNEKKGTVGRVLYRGKIVSLTRQLVTIGCLDMFNNIKYCTSLNLADLIAPTYEKLQVKRNGEWVAATLLPEQTIKDLV